MKKEVKCIEVRTANGTPILSLYLYSKQVELCVFLSYDSLNQYQKKNKKLNIQKLASQFKLYKAENNIAGLKTLLKKYPSWKEPKMEIKKLSKR